MARNFHQKHHSLFLNRLISMIYRHNRIYMDTQLEELNLHSGQYTYLIYLYHHDGQKQDDIVKALKIDKAGTTRALKKLEKSGYIFRKADEKDRRGNLVYLTDKAWQVQPILLKYYMNWLDLALDGFSEDDLDTLYRLLNKMATNAIAIKEDKENKANKKENKENKKENKAGKKARTLQRKETE